MNGTIYRLRYQKYKKGQCGINTFITNAFIITFKVKCPSDKRDFFCRKYSHSLSVNSQLSRHVATREAVLGPILCWKKGHLFKFKYYKMKIERNKLNFYRKGGGGKFYKRLQETNHINQIFMR